LATYGVSAVKIVALISGSGTTLANLIERTADGRLPARIVGVVSSKPDVLGVERALAAKLPVEVIPKDGGKPRMEGGKEGSNPSSAFDLPTYSEKVFDAVRKWRPDLVVLAGWLHLIRIPEDFRLKVLNIHPSLLPAFGGKGMYGRRVHEAVLAYGAKVSGCTVHFADDTYDTGPIVLQRTVPVLDDDTRDSLAARVFAGECEAYPEAIRLFAENRLVVDGRRVRVANTGPLA
jgi:phosphoribosylglycinamide formyltransferase-1